MGLRILRYVTRKADGTERSGRGTAPSAAGGFGGADTALTRLARPFVPKPFRSTGGMSTSADTMMSLAMGRHNTDDEIPEDQVNIGSIVSRKTSDRRYLPRRLKNMQVYLHTTPVNESLESDSATIHQTVELYESELDNFLAALDPVLEAKLKKKKKANEMSGVGAIAGYTGPMKGPQKPRQFYNTMAKVAGSEYLLDPLKTAKPKP